MGAGSPAARCLLLLLAVVTGSCRAHIAIPLRVSAPIAPNSSLAPTTPTLLKRSGNDGLALASDPAGPVNFMAMVENLQGDSGRGYYLELLIGTPGQKVGRGSLLLLLLLQANWE